MGDADAVQIDHVVALSDAWQKGAQQWDAGTRLAFAKVMVRPVYGSARVPAITTQSRVPAL